MIRAAVDSSNIKAIGYDSKEQTLEVEFNYGNTVYQYFNVPANIHAELMQAESKGKYLDRFIKGKFDYGRADEGIQAT